MKGRFHTWYSISKHGPIVIDIHEVNLSQSLLGLRGV